MPGTIETLSLLFTEGAIQKAIKYAKEIPKNNIYACLNWFYHERLVPTLMECTQNETEAWETIANATKEQAIELINSLSYQKSFSELLQIIRFQRALLGKEPYQFKLTDSSAVSSKANPINKNDFELDQNSFHPLKQPLIVFLNNIKNQSTPFSSSFGSSSISHELHAFKLRPYWVSYSILLEQHGENELTNEEILEMFTAMIIEEPEQFQNIKKEHEEIRLRAFISSLNRLTEDEIITLFQRKKLSETDFKIVVEAIFGDDTPSPKAFIKILACQPQILGYCYQKENEHSVWNTCLVKLEGEKIVNSITEKELNHYGHPIYSYSEAEFYDAFKLIINKHQAPHDASKLIIQPDNQFFNSLPNEAFVKLLSRLEFSTYQYEKEKNKRSQEIFEAIKDNQKTSAFNEKDWLALLLNADPTMITKVFASSEVTNLREAIQALTPVLFDAISEEKLSEKMVRVIYPYFDLTTLKNNAQKANLITILGKDLTQQSVNYCLEIISGINFNAEEIGSIVYGLPKNSDKSIHLIGTLFKKCYTNLYQKELQDLCLIDIEVVITLLTHEDENVKNRVFNELTIGDFAWISANPKYRQDIKKLLELGLLEKIKREKIKSPGNKLTITLSNEISNAFSILLKAENGAKNTDIFNFIYNNETIKFDSATIKANLVKSLSSPLDSDDIQLKSRLVEPSYFTEDKLQITYLTNEEVFQIFLDAQNNHYALPPKVVQTLFPGMVLKRSTRLLEELDTFLKQQAKKYHSEVIKNTRSAFILEAHKANTELFFGLAQYLQKNPSILIKIIIEHRHHDHLMTFLNDQKIASLLQPDNVIDLFLIAEANNLPLPPAISEKLVSQLLKCEGDLSTHFKRLFDKIERRAVKRNQKASPGNKEDHLFEKAAAKLLITIHQQTYPKRDYQKNNKHKQLIDCLDASKLALLVQHQNQHPQLIKLFQDPQLLEKLTLEIVLTLFTASPLLPTSVSKTLITYVGEKSNLNLAPENKFAKMHSAILLTLFLQYSTDSTAGFKQLIYYFSKNPQEISAILLHGVNQPNFNFNVVNLLNLLQHRDILNILILRQNRPSLIAAFVNLARSELNPENQLLIADALIPFLSKKIIMQIFIALAENKCTLDIKVQKRLVEKLNFKRLNQLIQNSQEDPQILAMALDNIFYSQIQRQKESFSKFFQPEVARIKRSTFEKKIQFADIADKELSTAKENLPLESEMLMSELFDQETGEIKPFYSQKESYIYLFYGEKERLQLKYEAIKETIQTIKAQGGVFLTDKNKYFQNKEEKPVILPEAKKQQLRQRIEESKERSKQTYK